ncbi:MAG: hypothetical protein WC668_01485 [Patescibacteria group bacterium]|jgi:hypothetical protein
MIDTFDKIIIAKGFLKKLTSLKRRGKLFDNHGVPKIEGISGSGSEKKLSILAEACVNHLNYFCELTCPTEAPTIQQITHLIVESRKIIKAAESAMPKTSTQEEEKS